jgi:hypothetical protein
MRVATIEATMKEKGGGLGAGEQQVKEGGRERRRGGDGRRRTGSRCTCGCR